MESNKNDAGKYLSCFVIDGEGKRHKILPIKKKKKGIKSSSQKAGG